MRPAIFLDRDGVLSAAILRDGRPYAPTRIEDFEILPDAGRDAKRLKDAGYLLVVATNQPDIARGLVARATVDAMHDRLRTEIPLDDVYVCECIEGPDCPCYKPKPGMLLAAAKKWGIDLRHSYMVGDRWRDIGAGKAAGCRTILIDRGYWGDRPAETPDMVVSSLSEACACILDKKSAETVQSPGD